MEIKYRLWDKENNCYYEPTYNGPDGDIEEVGLSPCGDLFMRKPFRKTCPSPNGKYTETIWQEHHIHESVFQNRFIKELWTGINDIEDVDIYEGDICVAINMLPEDNRLETFIVLWNDKKCSFYLRNTKNYESPDLFGKVSLKVIGNIHDEEQKSDKEEKIVAIPHPLFCQNKDNCKEFWMKRIQEKKEQEIFSYEEAFKKCLECSHNKLRHLTATQIQCRYFPCTNPPIELDNPDMNWIKNRIWDINNGINKLKERIETLEGKTKENENNTKN